MLHLILPNTPFTIRTHSYHATGTRSLVRLLDACMRAMHFLPFRIPLFRPCDVFIINMLYSNVVYICHKYN